MQEAKKKSGLNDQEEPKKKERHIVSWTPQEDDILRQQISLHGTENWAIIASKFKDKTTRQCRRRWYTYLNSDFKKGGWSPEEDMLLCEAQRIFGNRWTEIAKVVSGRTDNAVKNRFNTLCKKRAKYEALAKEKENNFSKPSNKRPIFHIPEDAAPAKKIRRSPVPDHTETCNFRDRSHPQYGSQQQRPPFAVLAQNIRNVNMVAQNTISYVDTSAKEVSVDAPQNKKTEGTFLKRDDPKITALMQQAELLSSLAMKVNNEKTEQSLENAWKILQDFLTRSKEKNTSCPSKLLDVDFQLEDVKDLIEELRSVNEGSQLPWRQPDPYEESPASSEYSTGSHVMAYIAPEKIETQAENNALCNELATEMQSIQIEENNLMGDCKMDIISSPNDTQVGVLQSSDVQIHNDMLFSAIGSTEFSSPLQVTPIFRSLAAGIPSPKFSESERSFLLKTLGMESPCPHPSTNPSQPPSCRRALLQSL